MKKNIVVVLSAADPEQAAIERLAREAGLAVAYAMASDRDGKMTRVGPGNAYQYDGSVLTCTDEELADRVVIQVECDYDRKRQGPSGHIIQIDHHRPGDPGYGHPPEDFWLASSIGQFVQVLHKLTGEIIPGFDAHQDGVGPWWPTNLEPLLIAAADHCLAAAYRGECPGVDPDELMAWRVRSRADFQGRSEEAILADIEAARKRLRQAAALTHCGFDDDGNIVAAHVADLRGEHIPELPEAAAREGIPFLADQTDRATGRKKVVLMAAPPHLVTRFMAGKIVARLCDYYGDPARGFAGGYYAEGAK